MWQRIEQLIQTNTHTNFKVLQQESISGGCINQAWKIKGKKDCYFVKSNLPSREAMFLAEKVGLEALASHAGVRVPKVIGTGSDTNQSFIILEYIALGQSKGDDKLFGEQLALTHQNVSPKFGFKIENTIGSILQINTWKDDWISFFTKNRLIYQLKLAKNNGYSSSLFDNGIKLAELTKSFFSNYQPQPSLLHGDLWSGNYAYSENNQPIIFDPACYYGDREADIAMTELFGGFSRSFYQAYNYAWALDTGYQSRKNLYNLYHVLNHCNMFGGGYESQAINLIHKLLAEIK